MLLYSNDVIEDQPREGSESDPVVVALIETGEMRVAGQRANDAT